MRKQIFIGLISIMLALSSLAYAQMPWDLIYHGLGPSITFDIPEEIPQVAANIQSGIQQGNEIVLQAKSDITSLQSALTATFNNIKSGAIFDEDVGPDDIGATFCGKDLKNVKVKKIAKKMRKVFFTYKSNKIADVNYSIDQRNKFYIENVYAIYQAARILQEKVSNDIRAKIELAKDCAEGDGSLCNIPSTDSEGDEESGGNNEVLFAYGQTLKAFDSVIRLWENVAALKAQLRAVKSMQRITPQLDTEEASDDADTATEAYLRLPPVFKHQSEQLAFAQVAYKDVASSLSNMEAAVSGNKSEAMEIVQKTSAQATSAATSSSVSAGSSSGATIIKQTVEFVSPEEPDNEHPLIKAESKLETLDNLKEIEDEVNVAMQIHNILNSLKGYKQVADQLAEMEKDHETVLQKLSISDQCAIHYIGEYFNNGADVWSGGDLGENVNNHDLRSGISAWAIEAYETAKAAETSTVTAEDIAQTSIDDEKKADLLDDPDMSKAEKEGQAVKVSVDASKQEESQEEGRESALLAWQIGAEAAKILGENSSQWGEQGEKSLVWTDTKNFYQQYLRRKYDNIKSYLKGYTSDDVLALVVAKLRGGSQDISKTKYQQQLQEARDKASAEIVQARGEVISKVQSNNTSGQEAVSGLEAKRSQIIAQMDAVNKVISDSSNEIADIRSVAENKATQAIEAKVTAKVVYSDSENTTDTVKEKILGVEALNSAVSGAKEGEIDEGKISGLEATMTANKAKLDNYQAQLDAIDEEIALAKLAAQDAATSSMAAGLSNILSLQAEWNESIQKSSQQYSDDVSKNLRAIIAEMVEDNPLIDPDALMKKAREEADRALVDLYEMVDIVVDEGYNEILGLKDKLYNPESHSEVVRIHQQTIDRIKALTISYNVAGFASLSNIAVYAALLSADTQAETEGFFIGATAKERDLKAPFAIPNFNLPHVREVFHFDATDFANVKPVIKNKKDRNITASDFLNYGGEIPLIWQYMLKDHAFIEAEYNLKEALDNGCVDVAFSRGGIMPCKIKGTSKVLDVNSEGEFLYRSDLNVSELSECMLIKMKNGKPYHTIFDSPVKFGSTFFSSEEAADPDCTYSELGMLLEADDNNNLQFRKRAFEAYRHLSEDEGEDLNDNKKDAVASANFAALSRNQIGDFLYFVENEKLQRENLEEYRKKYDESMDELKETLISYGFTPSDDFDLRNDSDYQLAVKKIKEIKNKQIDKASKDLSGVDQTDNEPAKEKVEILDKLISTMKKDTEGLMRISPTTADSNDIDADLKKAEADSAVVDKYKNSLKEDSKDYNDSEDPYCANY